MAKKTTFTVTMPDGTQAKRGSESRAYTHVIVGREDLDASRSNAVTGSWIHKPDYEYYASVLVVGVGGFALSYRYPVTQSDFDRATEILAGTSTWEEYKAKRIAALLADINKRGTGSRGPWQALQWSMSRANAYRAVGSAGKWSVDVQVLPVDAKVAA